MVPNAKIRQSYLLLRLIKSLWRLLPWFGLLALVAVATATVQCPCTQWLLLLPGCRLSGEVTILVPPH